MVKPHLDADLYFLVERMTILVDPKPVKHYLADPSLISDIKVESSIQAIQMAMKNCSQFRNWVKTKDPEKEEAHADDQNEQKEGEPQMR